MKNINPPLPLSRETLVRLVAPKALCDLTTKLVHQGRLTAARGRSVISNFEACEQGYLFEWGHIREEPIPSPRGTRHPDGPLLQWHLYPAMYIETAVHLGAHTEDAGELFADCLWPTIERVCPGAARAQPLGEFSPLSLEFRLAQRPLIESGFRAVVLPRMAELIVASTRLLLEIMANQKTSKIVISRPGHA